MSQKILETNDYKKFELSKFNRDVEKITELEKSMKKHGWIDAYPMHVIKNGAGKLLIKAGHHRFEVAEKLNIPVKYVICDDDATIHELEKSTTPWKMKDYMVSYIRCGQHSYQVVKKYHERTGISLLPCIAMLGGESAASHNKLKAFKDGRFQIDDPSHAELVADIILYCVKNKITWATNSLFVKAISRIARADDFSPSLFKRKIKSFSMLFEKQANLQGYMEMIESIYNRQNKNKVPLVFNADKAARERSAAMVL